MLCFRVPGWSIILDTTPKTGLSAAIRSYPALQSPNQGHTCFIHLADHIWGYVEHVLMSFSSSVDFRAWVLFSYCSDIFLFAGFVSFRFFFPLFLSSLLPYGPTRLALVVHLSYIYCNYCNTGCQPRCDDTWWHLVPYRPT